MGNLETVPVQVVPTVTFTELPINSTLFSIFYHYDQAIDTTFIGVSARANNGLPESSGILIHLKGKGKLTDVQIEGVQNTLLRLNGRPVA